MCCRFDLGYSLELFFFSFSFNFSFRFSRGVHPLRFLFLAVLSRPPSAAMLFFGVKVAPLKPVLFGPDFLH